MQKRTINSYLQEAMPKRAKFTSAQIYKRMIELGCSAYSHTIMREMRRNPKIVTHKLVDDTGRPFWLREFV